MSTDITMTFRNDLAWLDNGGPPADLINGWFAAPPERRDGKLVVVIDHPAYIQPDGGMACYFRSAKEATAIFAGFSSEAEAHGNSNLQALIDRAAEINGVPVVGIHVRGNDVRFGAVVYRHSHGKSAPDHDCPAFQAVGNPTRTSTPNTN